MSQYADVIVDISRGQLDKSFQYWIPPQLEGQIAIGDQVEVSFGSSQRKLSAFVLGLSQEPKIDPDRIRPIEGKKKGAMAVESQLIALAAWMRDHYGSTMNQALKTVLPVKSRMHLQQKRELRLLKDREDAKEELASYRAKKRHSIYKAALMEALIAEESLDWIQATKGIGASAAQIRQLADEGWLSIHSQEQFRMPKVSEGSAQNVRELNEAQKSCLGRFVSDWEEGRREAYLLYGVTGSGKTQVYIEMIDRVLESQREVIVLIPEIALTYQTLMRFYARFGQKVSIINSRMSAGERFDQFERARRGEVKIMLGPRSALFTPFAHLGLIIIDEEHESSYKSETVPRYHARETAQERVRLAQAALVLGSATPSLEAYSRAKEGIYSFLRMPHRVQDRPLPACEIVDMRQELMRGNRTAISKRLYLLMQERLSKREQIMLFVNRRGLAGFLSCRACGSVIKCPHCEVSLTLHKNGYLQCHYCGYRTQSPSRCPSCGSPYIGAMRAGTERFEETVQALFPEAKILRMDADTTRGKGSHDRILEDFAKQRADILIGTQMIVKGHDFPHVTLVAALAADLSLNASDFRGTERTFQLLCQAAGRAGRGERAGSMVIQTYQPKHYAIVTAARQDYESFYQEEMVYRRLMRYPPCSHMLVIQIMSEQEELAEKTAEDLTARLRARRPKGRIDGPMEARIPKLSDYYRRCIYIRDDDYGLLITDKNVVEEALREDKSLRQVMIGFDFDPMSSF